MPHDRVARYHHPRDLVGADLVVAAEQRQQPVQRLVDDQALQFLQPLGLFGVDDAAGDVVAALHLLVVAAHRIDDFTRDQIDQAAHNRRRADVGGHGEEAVGRIARLHLDHLPQAIVVAERHRQVVVGLRHQLGQLLHDL